MAIISTSISFLIITSIILPLFAYVIGILIPASHIVSRSVNLKLPSKRLWDILIDVSKYPEWQPKVEKVTVQEEKDQQTVFVEHSTRKRHTVIIHHQRAPYRCLLRILEERTSIDGQKKIPTFSGSWTFEIIQDKETEDQVTLKITEQGVIRKPIVRVTHLLLFGFHRRIDRFINDLQALIAKEEGKYSSENQGQEKAQQQDEPSNIISHSEQQGEDTPTVTEKVLVEDQESYHSTVLPNEQDTAASHNLVSFDEDLPKNDSTQATADGSLDQQVATNDTLMTESKLVNGWDMVSEIYERPSKKSA
ncbi:60S ribosomal protein L35, L29 [Mucor velutinosus]|uniref:60S ribosomal protein L35, L29 n=1 Tax=Mucor velutinosus TaxID=708070 RepID=A0AAN7I133_9FUNG|nr:60S ribosomal protein L35, L29 [Mucor velutinosus]